MCPPRAEGNIQLSRLVIQIYCLMHTVHKFFISIIFCSSYTFFFLFLFSSYNSFDPQICHVTFYLFSRCCGIIFETIFGNFISLDLFIVVFSALYLVHHCILVFFYLYQYFLAFGNKDEKNHYLRILEKKKFK